MKRINTFKLALVIISTVSSAVLAQDANIQQALEACKNITAQQRQMAKAAGYDIDSLCATANGITQPVDTTRPQVVVPSNEVDRQYDSALQNALAESANIRATSSPDLVTENDTSAGVNSDFNDSQVLRQFGYDLFDGAPTTFAPATEIPVMNDYVIGPGDNLEVQLFGKESNQYSLTVTREGVIQFPELGPITVAGLTFVEMKQLLNQRVEKQMIGVQASITMGTLRSIRIFVLGEVNRPGSYIVSSLSTMTNALFVSGGIRKIGSLRNIQLKRQGDVVKTLDLYDLLLKGDTRNDARLLPGDVLFIPPVGTTIGVAGDVKRPAIYELSGEKTLAEAVSLSGGYLPTAYPQLSRLERIDPRGIRTILDVDLTNSSGKSLNILNGDRLEIFSVLERIEDIVTLDGHVYRPGGYSFIEGMKISSLIPSIDVAMPVPDLDYGLVIREKTGTREIEIYQFSLRNILNNVNHVDNIPLSARDQVLVFSAKEQRQPIIEPIIQQLISERPDSEKAKVVSVNGAVRFPGRYPLVENMNPDSLIRASGGLMESAYTSVAEITRRDFSNPENATIRHINVDLSGAASSELLEADDNLIIKTIPNYQEKLTIQLSGEVKFPGKYEFYRGESLSKVIERAGGFTELAHVEAAFFSRDELRKREAKQLRELNQKLQSDIAAAQLEDVNSEKRADLSTMELLQDALEDTQATGRLVIDLPSLVAGDIPDIQLQDMDSLYVPAYRQEVTVIGEIQNPTSHLYKTSLDHIDYMELSGGTTEKADEDRIYVIKADGSVFLPEKTGWFKDNVSMEPGDTIVVPLDTDRLDQLTLWSTVSQIVYQMALGAAAINSL